MHSLKEHFTLAVLIPWCVFLRTNIPEEISRIIYFVIVLLWSDTTAHTLAWLKNYLSNILFDLLIMKLRVDVIRLISWSALKSASWIFN